MAVAVVQIEVVGLSVVCVVGGIGHLVVVIPGDTYEEVEISVAVHVGKRGRAGVANDRNAGSAGRLLERAVAAVAEEAGGAEGGGGEEGGAAPARPAPPGDP